MCRNAYSDEAWIQPLLQNQVIHTPASIIHVRLDMGVVHSRCLPVSLEVSTAEKLSAGVTGIQNFEHLETLFVCTFSDMLERKTSARVEYQQIEQCQ